jgi:benzoyl-CoA reductase/2-hydroxyglutaryl-CoA dehydratase subunit BcrC/BadD/HgdB
MTAEKERGLGRARSIYRDRAKRARELKAEGNPIIGYFCLYAPLEMMSALDLVPYRILGTMSEPIRKADSCLPTIVCPFIRSSLDMGLTGKYDFLDGVVMCHGCEVGEKTAHIWRTYLKPPYFHFVDTPHTVHKAAQAQFRSQLESFQKSLESYTGRSLSPGRLQEAVRKHNEQRSLVVQLYDSRKSDPPLISGSDTMQVMVALAGLPVEEGIELLREVLQEIQVRKEKPQRKSARLLIWGSIIDNTALFDIAESAGAHVVIDDTCVGSRAHFPQVDPTLEPLEGLARRYLLEIKCPRTFREATFGEIRKDYIHKDLPGRFGYLSTYADEWKVDGAILETVRYCDIHGYEVPGLKDYLDHVGLRHIYVEHDYSGALAQLRTRIQTFIEIIGS